MRKFPAWIPLAALLAAPPLAIAHTGGPLDPEGCHADHRTGTYHCHRGEAAGYTFPNKPAMQEAVRTGVFPDKTVDSEGFFSKLWPFGNKHEQEPAETQKKVGEEAPEGAGPEHGEGADLETGSTGSGGPASPEQEDAAQRLNVAKGLYEMGLITKEEYESKRQAILAEL